MKKTIVFLFIVCFAANAHAQTITIFPSISKASLRGLSAPGDSIVWASGSGGTVLRSVNGGNSWERLPVKGFEKTDFRAIEAFDAQTAVIMGVDSPGVILKTVDGGMSWKLVFRNDSKGIFLDAMSFSDDRHGIVIGDPQGNRFFVAVTSDGGQSWREISVNKRPRADSGEACFASSGTNIILTKKGKYFFVSGGSSSHFYRGQNATLLPLLQGGESTGANAVAMRGKTIIVVGGDFNKKTDTTKNCAVSKDRGKTWRIPQKPPYGYRSCVAFIAENTWISCGLNGVDITRDNGSNFTEISGESFHVLRKSTHGGNIFFAGNNGKLGKMEAMQ